MTLPAEAGAGQTLLELGPALLRDPRATGRLVRSVRDLSVLPISQELWLVVACDSVGAIGPKEGDAYPATGQVSGYFAARVPFVELLASGATPFLVVDTLSVERHPTGESIIEGVRRAAAEAGLEGGSVVTGSTEDNVPTRQTGIGVTVLGVVAPADFRPATGRPGDLVAVAGAPISAPDDDVRPGDPRIVGLDALRALVRTDGVHDVLPVGSRGIAAEVTDLASSCGAGIAWDAAPVVDLRHSAGPASCVVFAADEAAWPAITEAVGATPLERIGRLVPLG